jgi:hypothetical protein
MTSGAARPTGITILAVLAAIGGIGNLLIGAGVVTGVTGYGYISVPNETLNLGFGIGWLALGILELAFAWGAWTLKPWGWVLGVVIAIAAIVDQIVYGLASGEVVSSLISLGGIVGIAVPIIILYYLYRPGVKAAFGRA